jgi:hypothetical protein
MLPAPRGTSSSTTSRTRSPDPRLRSDAAATLLVAPALALLLGSLLVYPSERMTTAFTLPGLCAAAAASWALLAVRLDREHRRLASLLLGLSAIALVLAEPWVSGQMDPLRLLLTYSVPASLMFAAAGALHWVRRPRLRVVR